MSLATPSPEVLPTQMKISIPGLRRLQPQFHEGRFDMIPPIDVCTIEGLTLISDGHHRSVLGFIYGHPVPRRFIQRANFPDISDSAWQRSFIQPLIYDRQTLVSSGILTVADLYNYYQRQIYDELGLRRMMYPRLVEATLEPIRGSLRK